MDNDIFEMLEIESTSSLEGDIFYSLWKRCFDMNRSNLTRENHILNIASLSIVDARKIVPYTIVALNRRKWFDEM
jgi:hypothetical protein